VPNHRRRHTGSGNGVPNPHIHRDFLLALAVGSSEKACEVYWSKREFLKVSSIGMLYNACSHMFYGSFSFDCEFVLTLTVGSGEKAREV